MSSPLQLDKLRKLDKPKSDESKSSSERIADQIDNIIQSKMDIDPNLKISTQFPEDLKDYLNNSFEYFQDLLNECSHPFPVTFDHIFENKINFLKEIGIGRYAKCYQLFETSVYKVLEVGFIDNDDFGDLKGELLVTKRLSDLRNGGKNRTAAFPLLFDSWIVWDNGSEFEEIPNTSKKLYFVQHMAYAGETLKHFVNHHNITTHQVVSIVKQIALSFSASERALEFEHRDLHCENILVQPTTAKEISFKIDGDEYAVDSSSLKVTIIDFNLSRATVDGTVYSVPFVVPSDEYRHQIILGDWDGFFPKSNCHATASVLAYLACFLEEQQPETPFLLLVDQLLTELLNLNLCKDLYDHVLACETTSFKLQYI